jgi:hypothetical protein
MHQTRRNGSGIAASADRTHGEETLMHFDRRLTFISAATGGIILLAGCGAMASTPPTATPPAAKVVAAPPVAPTVAPPTAVPTPTPVPTPVPTAVPTPKPTPEITVGEANAAASAAQYLSEDSGWSRAGLIAQLDSSYGEGYSRADATYGVDAQGADWNAQAALSAKGYLALGPWSRSGLIAQLDSSYGEGFTYAQAVYGVTAAGL